MRIVVSGSSGLVGTALIQALSQRGHTANRLVRPGKPVAGGDVRWDPVAGQVDLEALEGADAVVHLAGASIAAGRWTARQKALIRSSRVDATRGLIQALGRVKRPPQVLVSASAVGYYGSRGEEILTEESAAGGDFLAEVARGWEAAALGARQFGIRTVLTRFGLILARQGGALPRMLLPFRLGLGGRLGSGRQWTSWVALPDAVAIVQYALEQNALEGAVNAVSPQPVQNREFTRILGRVLRRPTMFPVPAFALRVVLGEMADALLLSSVRVVPERLQRSGYVFRHPDLELGLRDLLRARA